MPDEVLYSSRDYLDDQFLALHKRLDKLDSLPSDVAVLVDWRTTHETGHTRWRALKLSIAGLLLSAAGLWAKLSS